MMYGLEVALLAVTKGDDRAGVMDHVDLVTQELIKLEACTPELLDSSFGLNAATGRVDVEITVTADSFEDAFAAGMTCLRTAIHAAGGGTPHWDHEQARDAVVMYELGPDGAQVRPLVDA